MSKTSIEWTDHSVNPIRFNRGHFCQKISPGCTHCYASRFQPRVGNPQFKGTGGPLPVVFSDDDRPTDGNNLWFDDSKLQDVLRRRKPTRYFWCDMTDLFGAWVPDEWIDRCFATMALTPQHTHQVLTKRADRMAAYIARTGRCITYLDDSARTLGYTLRFDTGNGHPLGLVRWPLPNVWLGTSVEDQQRADERIPHLLRTPAAVRFLSVEPLLGAVDLRRPLPLDGIGGGAMNPPGWLDTGRLHWVIVGGESGPGARPMHVEWARSIVSQCKSAGVACFVKQLGAEPTREVVNSCHGGRTIERLVFIRDRKGGDPAEWPEDLRVREFPEAAPCP